MKRGEERLEWFAWEWAPEQPRLLYEYLASNGEHFACVADNEAEARAERDAWLAEWGPRRGVKDAR